MSEFPYQGRFFEINGQKLHYLDEGEGTPVLMLHGNPTWSFYYRHLVAALSPTFRCIVPDHIGCGRSDKPSDRDYSYRLSQRIADIEALLEHLEIASCHLVVHDWGGMIGMGWATQRPAHVQSIVAINTAAFPLPPGQRVPFSLRAARTPGLGSLLVRGMNLFVSGAAKHCVHRRPLDDVARRGLGEPYDSWTNRIAVHRFVQDIPLSPTHPSWADVERTERNLSQLQGHPLLVCWGMQDFVFTPRFLAEWKRHFPNAEYLEIADGGHFLLEDAREDIVPRIEAFLTGP